jgi:hypothetical protein
VWQKRVGEYNGLRAQSPTTMVGKYPLHGKPEKPVFGAKSAR